MEKFRLVTHVVLQVSTIRYKIYDIIWLPRAVPQLVGYIILVVTIKIYQIARFDTHCVIFMGLDPQTKKNIFC